MSPPDSPPDPHARGTVVDQTVGFVVIGRNEGDRLARALRSIGPTHLVVYVDSGSSDGSVELARRLGAHVVLLDPLVPFTAARARNAGARRLAEIQPHLCWVMFMDGDCELLPGFLEAALVSARSDAALAVVAGRRRERCPGHSVYNRLCDDEWDTPVGDAKACGGDALIRLAAFGEVGGYDDRLIAGEEPELCVRLRRACWRVLRIDADMTLHDAAMTRLAQWWKRAKRAGHAYAEGAALHGAPPERHWVRETRPGVFRWQRASFLVLARFPEVLGVLRFELGRHLRRPSRIMEHR